MTKNIFVKSFTVIHKKKTDLQVLNNIMCLTCQTKKVSWCDEQVWMYKQHFQQQSGFDFSNSTSWNQNKMQHSFTPFFITYLLMLATRFFINLSRSWFLMSCSWVTLLISFIQRLPLVAAARCSARAADTCCSVQAKVLTSSRFPTYHGSVLWIMSSTRLPSTPHIARCLPPSPLQSPLINSFNIVNHLCQLLVIIDN